MERLLIETKEIGNHRIKIYYDSCADSPCVDWDMAAIYLFEYNDRYHRQLHRECNWREVWGKHSDGKRSLNESLIKLASDHVPTKGIIEFFKKGTDKHSLRYNKNSKNWELLEKHWKNNDEWNVLHEFDAPYLHNGGWNGEKHRKCDCREDMEAFLLYAFAKNIYNDLDLDESDTEERKMFGNDICARMFSGLRGKYIDGSYDCPFNPLTDNLQLSCTHNAMWFTESVKPYLFPMSSMTEEQEREFFDTCNGMCEYYWTAETFDWLNANHFDYRGLIPKGLAIDATGLGIY